MDQVIPAPRLDPWKFRDPVVTAKGEARATVALRGLETLWFNTGTLCNLTCANCYIESSPQNDRLAWLSAADVEAYLDEIARDGLPTQLIGFTGGEPFMNRDITAMLEAALSRGFAALVLTNAMTPMRHHRADLLRLRDAYGERLRIRVSLDHYTQPVHEAERGARSWKPTLDGLAWLARNGFPLDVAGRRFTDEPEATVRAGYARLFAELGVPVDATDPVHLMLFPEMDPARDVPEITTACWGILHKSPDDVMCASARMVVKRKDADHPVVLACTLLAYDERFVLGRTLAEASRPVALNHPFCASFCVLGGASCSR
jgi:pyruvate-formate lyase-activating enzyme